MSFNVTNCISKSLSLTDANITFTGEIYEESINNLKTLVYEAILTYDSSSCPVCGNLDSSRIIKHGSKKSIVRILPVNGQPAVIRLKKQRFLCKECNSTFVAESNIVKKYCSISNRLKAHFLSTLSQKISEKDIAKINNVSHSTVSRYIDNDFKKYSPPRHTLPRNLSFDEFKSTKDAKGAMSFIMTDLDKKRVIDIVENRQLYHLKRYFNRFTKKARKSVRTITIDIYQPYVSLIKQMFPNAKIIYDRFHLINNLSRALLKTRIDAMKLLPVSSMEYKRLKRYWKLIQLDFDKLDARDFRRWVHFKEMKTEYGLVMEAISVNETLKEAYKIYQILLQDFKRKDTESLKKHLEAFRSKGSKHIRTAIETMLKDFEYVANALKYGYSNGFTEGVNNFIKVLKRIAFGYKSFFHFRNRILITLRLKEKFDM